MAVRLQRFDFGAMRDFRNPAPVAPAPDELHPAAPEAPPPPPQFSEEELSTARSMARQEGYDEGFAAGLAQAAANADAEQARAATAINRLGEQLGTLDARYHALIQRESEELSALVLLIARKVAGDAMRTHYADCIHALVAQCLPVFFSRPRLLIDLHPDALATVSAQVEPLLQQRGFEGEVQFRSNAALAVADVVLDWGHGQARRSTESLWQEIESLIAKLPLQTDFSSAPAPVTEVIEDTLPPITPEPGA